MLCGTSIVIVFGKIVCCNTTSCNVRSRGVMLCVISCIAVFDNFCGFCFCLD